MLDFLPIHLKKIIKKFDINNIYELRLRKNSPLSLCVKGNFIDLDYLVSENDVADVINNSIKKIYVKNPKNNDGEYLGEKTIEKLCEYFNVKEEQICVYE